MPRAAVIELTDLRLETDIGTYGPDDVVPEAHILDLRLVISPDLVQVPGDGMAHVFDYDPLIAEIDRIARDGHYETQEWLMTRIARACAAHPEISGVEISLRKRPVLGKSGNLGVTLSLDDSALAELRPAA